MSDSANSHRSSPLGWLLLRDGHAVPISDLTPDALKRASRDTILAPETDLRHRARLNAIVDSLGFKGDFGDYIHRGWVEFRTFLADHGCTAPGSLFLQGEGLFTLRFGRAGPGRRQLADRIFLGPQPAPRRVFLGHGVDWAAWDLRGESVRPRSHYPWDLRYEPVDRESTIDWLLTRRIDFDGQWGFVDDKLVADPTLPLVDKTYFPDPHVAEEQRKASLQRLRVAVRAFRFVADGQQEGWVDVLRVNDDLVVLRGDEGTWTLLWRDLREEGPPAETPSTEAPHELMIPDRPSSLLREGDLARRLYFRRGAWDELEAHDAEQHYYDQGGDPASRRRISGDEVRRIYLVDRGTWPQPARSSWIGPPPAGFHRVQIGDRCLFVSDLVTVGDYQRMLDASGYLERRTENADDWTRANEGEPHTAPVGATWSDAQAYCAWKERELGVAVRLFTLSEHRSLRPFYSSHYEQLTLLDFPWENRPPRPLVHDEEGDESAPVPSAVVWSEPRFHVPDEDLPDLPDDQGSSTRSRKRWIVDFPPRAAWSSALPVTEHRGLSFIDAWDAYEWCQEEGWVAGRFWEGQIAPWTWGAYKNIKISFRLLLDVEPV